MLGTHGNSNSHKAVLHNIDILAYHKYTAHELRGSPSFQRVQKEAESELVRDLDGNPYSLTCDIGEFRRLGPGVYLVFLLMKYLLVMMTCLLPLPIVNVIVLIVQDQDIVNTNMETIFESTTISSLHSSQNLIIALNFVVLIVLLIAMIYWKHLQTSEVLKCSQQSCLSSYFTVILTQIPNYYRQNDLKDYLQLHYGKVHEIYTPKDYEGDLIQYQEMYQVLTQFKQQRESYLRNKQTSSCLKLVQKFIEYENLHQRLTNTIVDNKHYRPHCAFVTFQTVISKEKLLEDQQNTLQTCCVKNQQPQKVIENKLYKNQKLNFKSCEMEPNGIHWEHLKISTTQKVLRRLLIFLLLALFLFASIVVFLILAAAESSLFLDQYDHLTYNDVVHSNDPLKIKSFCIEQGIHQFSNYPLCQQYRTDFILYTALYCSIPLVIIFMKIIFSLLMKQLVILRKHKYQVHQIEWKIMLTTLFYFITTGFIKWFLYISFAFGSFHFELLTYFLPLINKIARIIPIRPDRIHLYHDFQSHWVAHASHKVILIAIFAFNFVIILQHCIAYFSAKLNKSKASSQPTQQKMKLKLQGKVFKIEFIYAQTLSIFLFCMLYFSCMPVIFILAFISMFFFYWTTKYKLIRCDKKPPIFAHSISSLATKIIFIGLAINAFVSPLYYGNLHGDSDSSWIERYATYWYYTVTLFVIILFAFFYQSVMKIYYLIKEKILCYMNSNTYRHHTDRLDSMTSQAGGLHSYSMHNNKQYAPLLRILCTINRKQIHHTGFSHHQEVQQIRASVHKAHHQFVIFHQLLQFLSTQIKTLKKDPKAAHILQSNLLKCQQYLEMLNKVKEQAIHDIEEEHKCDQLYKQVQSRLKERSGMSVSRVRSSLSRRQPSSSLNEHQNELDSINEQNLNTANLFHIQN